MLAPGGLGGGGEILLETGATEEIGLLSINSAWSNLRQGFGLGLSSAFDRPSFLRPCWSTEAAPTDREQIPR